MIPRRAALALAGAAAAAAVIVAWRLVRTPDAPSAPAVTGPRGGAAASAAAAPELTTPRYPDVVPPAALPASLEGSEPDGAVTADAAGRLVVDLELRRLFDHFLAASGEEPIAMMRARIIGALRARLPATAAGEAIAILDRYLAYRDAARQLAPAGDPAADLAQVRELRARMFTPDVARALFGDEEAAIAAAIARRDAALDPALAPAERERRLAELDARAPPAERDARAAATAPIEALARETALRAAGATDRQIAAARTAALGAEAAARLAELDRAHAAWDARLARFRAARAALLADPRLDDATRRRRIDELLAGSFSPPERIRVEALDRMASGSGAP